LTQVIATKNESQPRPGRRRLVAVLGRISGPRSNHHIAHDDDQVTYNDVIIFLVFALALALPASKDFKGQAEALARSRWDNRIEKEEHQDDWNDDRANGDDIGHGYAV
jgi:hypothetical protein